MSMYTVLIIKICKKRGFDCCWATEGHFRSDFLCRIRIRAQNRTITSGFWDIWGYVHDKWLFWLLL